MLTKFYFFLSNFNYQFFDIDHFKSQLIQIKNIYILILVFVTFIVSSIIYKYQIL